MSEPIYVGSIVIYKPSETDGDQDWLTFIVPAWKGHVQITTHIRSPHIESALKGLTDEEDVVAFLDMHRPWQHVSFSLHC